MTQSVGITTTGGVKAIEDIRVGDRVVGFNPLATSVDRTAVEPDSRTWRKIALHVPKSNGDEIYCELLRPIKWFDEHGVTVGGTIELDTAELGGQSFATVLSVHEHPTISEGDGNVVTGTYQHRSVEVIHLRLENGETLAVTPNHPIWCEERHDFIEASEFEAGDHFRSAGGGLVRVVATMAGFGDTRVYNLEVNREHVYHVGRTGVLVHNKSKRLPDVTT